MTAHPHVDPATGGLAFFGYDCFGPPFLRYHELDAAGTLVHSTEVDVPRATMSHDFAVTERRVAFLDLPVVFDLDLAGRGVALPFRWEPEAGARIGVLDRGGRGDATAWVGLDPCYAFHVMNAFDDAGAVVLDVCRYDSAFDTPEGGLLSTGLATLERWRVDPVAKTVSTTRLDDRTVEFPRIDDTLAGRPYRYGYCTELVRDEGTWAFPALLRYDLGRDVAARWDPGPGRFVGEPVFVRDPDGRADDEGWVLSVVYDAGRDASDVVVLDASGFGAEPEAVIHLPARVPYGFHGSWVPASCYR
jgi:carotenoid cleavage dioxygenase